MASMVETLVVAVVGGLIATLGQVATPIAQHFFARRSSASARKREMAMRASEAIAEVESYLSGLVSIRAFGNDGQQPISPLWKVRSIVGVNFKSLRENLPAFSVSVHALELWTTQAAQKRLAGNTANISDGFDDPYRNFIAEKVKLENLIFDQMIAVED